MIKNLHQVESLVKLQESLIHNIGLIKETEDILPSFNFNKFKVLISEINQINFDINEIIHPDIYLGIVEFEVGKDDNGDTEYFYTDLVITMEDGCIKLSASGYDMFWNFDYTIDNNLEHFIQEMTEYQTEIFEGKREDINHPYNLKEI